MIVPPHLSTHIFYEETTPLYTRLYTLFSSSFNTILDLYITRLVFFVSCFRASTLTIRESPRSSSGHILLGVIDYFTLRRVRRVEVREETEGEVGSNTTFGELY